MKNGITTLDFLRLAQQELIEDKKAGRTSVTKQTTLSIHLDSGPEIPHELLTKMVLEFGLRHGSETALEKLANDTLKWEYAKNTAKSAKPVSGMEHSLMTMGGDGLDMKAIRKMIGPDTCITPQALGAALTDSFKIPHIEQYRGTIHKTDCLRKGIKPTYTMEYYPDYDGGRLFVIGNYPKSYAAYLKLYYDARLFFTIQPWDVICSRAVRSGSREGFALLTFRIGPKAEVPDGVECYPRRNPEFDWDRVSSSDERERVHHVEKIQKSIFKWPTGNGSKKEMHRRAFVFSDVRCRLWDDVNRIASVAKGSFLVCDSDMDVAHVISSCSFMRKGAALVSFNLEPHWKTPHDYHEFTLSDGKGLPFTW